MNNAILLGCERHLCRAGAVLIKGASSPLHQPRLPIAVSTLTSLSVLQHLALLIFSSAVKQVPQYSYREAWPASRDHGLYIVILSGFNTHVHPTKVCCLTD